jgi:hypothetical protein
MGKLSELRTALLDILHATKEADLRIIVGGGYGIFLKREYVKETGVRTLLKELPEARATNDLDIFLRPELLIESEKLKPLAKAIEVLGYEVIPSAQKFQFIKDPKGAEEIKIDLLTGPRESFKGKPVRTDGIRAQPKKSVGIHARTVDEAPTLEEGLMTFTLRGSLTSGEEFDSEVCIPHPFTYIMMKLYAFRDFFEIPGNKDEGQYHALDLYTILATTTEDEWEKALELAVACKGTEPFQEASRIVAKYFSEEIDFGIIRLKESKYFEERLDVKQFISLLQELFGEK